MSAKRDYIMFLEDIIECAEKINVYTKGITWQKFSEDEKTKDAVIVRIQIVGEAIRNLPSEFKRNYKNIDWKKYIKLRNIYIHNYFGLDSRRLWKTAMNEIPEIKERVLKILEDLKIKKLL